MVFDLLNLEHISILSATLSIFYQKNYFCNDNTFLKKLDAKFMLINTPE